MKYKEYKYLKELYELNPTMNAEQKYEMHFMCEVEKKTEYSEDVALAIASNLSDAGFVDLAKNKDDAKERPGYVHLVRITYKGVLAMKEYPMNVFMSALRSVVIPAVVYIIVSAICAKYGFN